MPSQKTRSKEDTWTPDELSKALNKTSERRHHRDRDEERKRDRINGDERQRRHRDEDTDRRRRHRDEDENGRDARLTEEERDRQREERRRKREGKDGGSSKEKKGRELQFRGKSDNRDIELNDVEENDSDDRRRRHHGDRDRRQRDDGDRERRHHDRDEDDDRERRRRHRDDDNDRDKRRKHRDEEDAGLERRRKQRDDDDREKRRKHREEEDENQRERRRKERRMEREKQEEEERRRRHEEKRERRKEEDRKKERDRDRDERSDKHRDKRDRDKRKESEREKEERREREREERRREKEGRHRQKEEKSSKQKEEEEKKEEEDDYNYEEDFEDYEEDFEDEEDDDNEEVSRPRNVQLTQAPAHNRTTVMSISLGNQESIHKKDQAGSRLDYSDSEVNDVLRALDAENERLLNSSSRSPQVSAKYGRDRGREDSDRGEDSDDGYQKAYQPRMDRPRTAINFVSAKQRAVSRKTASKTIQRGKDLLKMLELDYASFDIMDLPPVNEYDLYIRAFGSSDTRQAYVQTNDDNIDREIQTEEVDARQKWTQHPAEDFNGCGRGDGEKDIEDEEESQSKHNKEQDLGRLNKFLEKAGQVIAILLEEGKEEEVGSKGQSQTHINVSEGYTRLDVLPILQDRHVIFSHFSPVQPNLLLTAYSPPPQISEENPVSKRGIICVWNTNEPSYPQKILACSSQPRCCCFSPVKPSLVFAGMVDGSIAMWDLREPTSIHQPTFVNEESYSLRYPTYDTACVLKEENHHSPVSSILPIYSYIDTTKSDTQQSQASEDTSSGLSFQLVSTEESAVLHFWVVAEIGIPEIAGSENDLGLAPGAGVKLLKSSSLTMSNPSKDTRLQSGLRALDMSLMPNDPNHFYIATDSGCILHGIRFGKRTFPRAHSPVIDTIVDVVSIDFSPFDQPCFLAGCSDGTFSLYHTKSENPLITWSSITKGQALQCIRWSRSRPCVFYVLDVTSTLYVFDLLEGDVQPKYIETISQERITSFSQTTVQRPDGLGTSGKDAQMLFSFGDGKTEVHTITKSLRVPEQLETDYLGSYIQRF